MFQFNRTVLAVLAMGFAFAGGAEAGQKNWIIFGKRDVATQEHTHKARRQSVRRETWPPIRRRQAVRNGADLPGEPGAMARRSGSLGQTAPVRSYQPPARFRRQTVAYTGPHGPDTIVINTTERMLYHVHSHGIATRYGVGVGKAGFEWSGSARIQRKAEWPNWRPPTEMIARERKKGRELPAFMPGGPQNPLGARALYLYEGGRDTLYRIHGTNNPRSIGLAMSSGCIRMMNADVTHLYENVAIGTKVVVL